MTRSVTWNGVRYPSMVVMGRALGVSKQRAAQMIKRGPPMPPGRPKQPCAALGWDWPSQKEAARDLGVSTSTVFSALERGNFDSLVQRIKGRRVPA